MTDHAKSRDKVLMRLLDRINDLTVDQAAAAAHSRSVVALAEAYAWIVSPAQSHAGGAPAPQT